MGVYLAGALRSGAAGATAGGIFAGTYALLYLFITFENYALLAGPIALFTLLSVVMLLTRGLDWYAAERLATARSAVDSQGKV